MPESTSKAADLRDALQQIDALGVEGAAPVNEKEVCNASLQVGSINLLMTDMSVSRSPGNAAGQEDRQEAEALS